MNRKFRSVSKKKRVSAVKKRAIRAAIAATKAVIDVTGNLVDTADADGAPEESEDDIAEFLNLDAKAQSARKKAKDTLTKHKEEAAAAASVTSAASVNPSKPPKRTKSKSTKGATK